MQIEKRLLSSDELDGNVLAAFRDCEKEDPQFGIDWLSNMAATALDEAEEAVIYIARRSCEDFIACAMKVNSRNGHASALSTFYTTTYSPVIASTTPVDLLVALFEHFARRERFATLTLTPMDSDSPVFDLVQSALVKAGWSGIHQFFCFGNWIHDLKQHSYESYLATRPSRLRNTITRKTRQFLSANRGQLELVTGGDGLESAIESFIAIYSASWKRSEPYPDFIPQLLRLSAGRGWLRIGIARYDSKAVASQIWIVFAGTAYIFKLAYHQDYGQYSPGTVLTAYLMEHVIDKDSVCRIDYLSGDDSYKQDWMSCRRERHGLAAYNRRSLRGNALNLGHVLNAMRKNIFATFRSEKAANRRLRD